ncbi:hypothetical protein [Allokutzneria oryzae]|uniref:ABC transporter permease n=1 Tax=Allokutzneria oryzae TaxID=1378989 RepID=A0ABV5ZTB4_9PSEU
MIWVAWRQQRATLVTLAVVLLGGVATLALLRSWSTSLIEQHSLASCVLDTKNAECARRASLWRDEYYELLKYAQVALVILPVLLGMFCGAPLFAREFEQGTHVLAFTQSVSRARWMAVKVAMAMLPALLVVLVLQAFLNGWADSAGDLGPRTEGPYAWSHYDTTGLIPLAHTLFAFGVGVFAGIAGRRSLLAMTVTLGMFAAVRLAVPAIRPMLAASERRVGSYATGADVPKRSLVDSYGYMDSAGRVVPDGEALFSRCIRTEPDKVAECMGRSGVTQVFTDFVGPEAAGTVQLVESALFAGVAVVLLAAGVWWLRRRI